MFIGRVLELNGDITYNKYKESTHSKMWMPQVKLNVQKDTAYSVGRQSRHFFYLSFFERKVSNAKIDVLKSNKRFITSKTIEIISKSVICATPLPLKWSRRHPHPVMGTFKYYFRMCMLVFPVALVFLFR